MQLPADYAKLNSKQRKLVREEYTQLQDGLCFYCREELDGAPAERVLSIPINWKLFPQGFLNNPIHLQHSHRTGLTEGAVHAYCNAIMWQSEGR